MLRLPAENSFSHDMEGAGFQKVCARHTRVIPAESYTALETAEERRRSIAYLQHRTVVLDNRRLELEDALKKRLAKLDAAGRQKNELLAMLGHELRNPLSAVLNALEIV
jgi:signal transduction histidine kinase